MQTLLARLDRTILASIRLLMNLVEGIYHKHNQDQEQKMAGAVQGMQPGAAGEANKQGRKLLVHPPL